MKDLYNLQDEYGNFVCFDCDNTFESNTLHLNGILISPAGYGQRFLCSDCLLEYQLHNICGRTETWSECEEYLHFSY